MGTPEFWPALTRLAESYDEQGVETDERQERILEQFRGLPPAVQRRSLDTLLRLSMEIPDLYAVVAASSSAAATH